MAALNAKKLEPSSRKKRDTKRARGATLSAANLLHVATNGKPDHPDYLVVTLALLLGALTLALYSPAGGNPFVNYDDPSYVTENPHVKAGLSWSTLVWAFESAEASNWHPITWLSHAADYSLYGVNPTGHHWTSVLMHSLNVILLFLLLRYSTGAVWQSLTVAALFAVHPLNVESVAWISERKNVLSMLFLLLTLAAYGWYARKPNISRYVSVVLLFALGLAAKPMIVTLPCALLLLDYWPLRRAKSSLDTFRDGDLPQRSWKWLALEKVPLLALSTASSIVTLYAQRLSMPTTEALPLTQRLGNAVFSYAMYLWKAFWPARLAAFYPHEGATLSTWQVGSSLVVLAAVTIFVWRQSKTRPYLLLGWLWFLGNLVPVIGLVQVGDQAMADRYVYLPLLGIFVMVVWGVSSLAADRLQDREMPALATIAAIVFIALSIVTERQIATWRSSNELWSHALEVTSGNYMAEDYVGSALLEQTYETTGQRYSDEATTHFRKAMQINPHDAISHLNLGADYHEHGRLEEAIEQYIQVLQYTNDTHLMAKAYIALGAAYGQLHGFDKAEQAYRAAMQLEPENKGLLLRLGQLGMEQRIAELNGMLAAHPNAENYVVLGQMQQSLGRPVEARKSFEEALKFDPKSEDAQQGLVNIGR